ncbi:MAG TPA: hypothetical protein VF548_00110 [Allosphingosinicella sp.]|jgi:hypothetical protein
MTGDLISAAADVTVAIFAGVALFIGWRQVGISRELSALSAYEQYHLASLQHPQFGSGTFNTDGASEEQLSCYRVFVSFCLMTGERILSLFPTDPFWRAAIKDDVLIHARLIRSPIFQKHLENQIPLMRQLIDEAFSEEGAPDVVPVDVPHDVQETISTWIERQPDPQPSRSEAIRRLIERGLQSD